MKTKIFSPVLLGVVVFMLLSFTSCLNTEEPFDAAEQFEKDQAALDNYIATQGYTDVKTDTSDFDVRYVMVKEGTGDAPVGEDWMYVNYKGSLLNGSIFDERDSVYIQLAGGLIGGWQILMPYLREGGQMVMFLPSFYGYRQTSSEEIPANSPLIFDVKLHEVLSQFEYEQRKIEEYIEEKGLVAETDTVEGLKYIIDKDGAGDYVQPTDKLNVDYEGRYVLNDEEVFLQGTNVGIQLDTYSVKGWKILLPYARVGSTVVMFIPSKFAYGKNGSLNVDGNVPLKFEVTINSKVE